MESLARGFSRKGSGCEIQLLNFSPESATSPSWHSHNRHQPLLFTERSLTLNHFSAVRKLGRTGLSMLTHIIAFKPQNNS